MSIISGAIEYPKLCALTLEPLELSQLDNWKSSKLFERWLLLSIGIQLGGLTSVQLRA